MREDCSSCEGCPRVQRRAMLPMKTEEGDPSRLRGCSLAGEDGGKMRVEVRKCQLQRRVQAQRVAEATSSELGPDTNQELRQNSGYQHRRPAGR